MLKVSTKDWPHCYKLLLLHQSPMLHSDYTVTGQWLWLLTTADSTVTTQLINCVVTVLLAVNKGDYTLPVQSPCSHCAAKVTDDGIGVLLCK